MIKGKYICDITDVEFSNIRVSELHKNLSQPTAFIEYKYDDNIFSRLDVQIEPIILTSYGVPSRNDKFYSSDACRNFIKIPLDPNQEEYIKLRKHLEAADVWAGSDEIRKKLFGSRWKKYIYHPVIKSFTPCEEEEIINTNKKQRLIKMDYVKMKLDLEKSVDNVFNVKQIFNNSLNRYINPCTLDHLTSQIKYMSKIKILFSYNKIWCSQSPLIESNKFMYGLGLKIQHIEYGSGLYNNIDTELCANIDKVDQHYITIEI